MRFYFSLCAALIIGVGLFFTVPAFAEDHAKKSSPVSSVSGQDITNPQDSHVPTSSLNDVAPASGGDAITPPPTLTLTPQDEKAADLIRDDGATSPH